MTTLSDLTRRDFLKLSGAGLLGLLLSELQLDQALALSPPSASQGRVAFSGIDLYDIPSFYGKKLKVFGKDEVVTISAEVTSEDQTTYNRLWYRIEDKGYAYSGWIQPVRTVYNEPKYTIPASGVLGEVTIPYVDTHDLAGSSYDRNYRLYYGATHWIQETIVNSSEQTIWYRLYDKKIRGSYFAPAQALRIIPDEELKPLSSEVPGDLKYIYVDLTSQSLIAFEDDKPVLISSLSSGSKGSRTPLGIYKTFHKGPSIHMTNDEGDKSTYDLPGVPWVTFFTGTGISFHGTYWHNDFGRPKSHGCINLPLAAAKCIYRWSLPTVPPDTPYLYKPGQGTTVQIVKP